MASITFDGQSLFIDGRRLWIVGGTLHASRTTRDQWPALIQAAKQGGLNTITVPVIWARHEPRPNQFDFHAGNDLRHLCELIGQAGMHAVVRIGPFVGAGWDLGGLPAWVLGLKDVALRAGNTAFLEASSRFIGAVAKQIRDLQVTSPKGGPIILVQSESAWTCGSDAMGKAYLGELDRYLRESGFDVPIINNHQLWQGVEGQIDTWTGWASAHDQLLANLRQLGAVRGNQPRIVSTLNVAAPRAWGDEGASAPVHPEALERALLEILAAGGQYNVEPLSSGTSFGFAAGRLTGAVSSFSCTQHGAGAPLDEAGRPGALYRPLRNVSMFASRFARLLSHLDAKQQPVAAVPSGLGVNASGLSRRAPGASRDHVVIHRTGSQGSVAFIFGPGPDTRDPKHGAGDDRVALLLPDGTSITVHLEGQATAWCLFDTRLSGRAQLDFCNLSAFALVGRVFVAFGPAGTPAHLSINGSPLVTSVPGADDEAPEIVDHEGVLVVICSREQLERLHVADDAVYFGAAGVNASGQGIMRDAQAACVRLGADGSVSEDSVHALGVKRAKLLAQTPAPAPEPDKKAKKKVRGKQTPVVPAPEPKPLPPLTLVHEALVNPSPAPSIESWRVAHLDEYIDGESPRFASVAGPADLNGLGAPHGYGWYRVGFKAGLASKALVAWPESADRLHLFLDGHAGGIVGVGPGAQSEANLTFKRQAQTLVVLAENLGRFSGGQRLGDPKGVFGHLWHVRPMKVSKAALHRGEPVSPLGYRERLLDVHEGEVTDPVRVAWTWEGKRKGPVLVRLNAEALGARRGLVLLNGAPIEFFDATGPATIILRDEQVARGTIRLELALLGAGVEGAAGAGGSGGDARDVGGLGEAVSFLECLDNLTAEGRWAFAKWERPTDEAFKREPSTTKPHGPAWFRAEFNVGPRPAALHLNVASLSKGQVYVNNHHLGRYFSQTVRHAQVGPQTKLFVPASFLHAGQANDLVVFDEHGVHPAKIKFSLA
jgi:hypothetical protein